MNQTRKELRFCGYCNEVLAEPMDIPEFMEHLDICEKAMVKWLRKTGKPPKENT
jgi:hypothetical protein